MSEAAFNGLLSIEVNAPPIVAGTAATVSLIIRNPFAEAVVIESIQAPSSAPLLPDRAGSIENAAGGSSGLSKGSLLKRVYSDLASIRIQEVQFGPLIAEFPRPKRGDVYFDVEPSSKLTIKAPFNPDQDVYVKTAEGAEVVYDAPLRSPDAITDESRPERVIPPQQEDLASFELKTARWLLVKPKVLNLHALIRYKVGNEPRSQVVPVTLSIQPPVKSIISGTVSGGILGYLARQLNTGLAIDSLPLGNALISILGIIVMATILSIVLSRQESSKGFVTLEDFYGAFVVGAVLGYTGTGYFENVIGSNMSGGKT